MGNEFHNLGARTENIVSITLQIREKSNKLIWRRSEVVGKGVTDVSTKLLF